MKISFHQKTPTEASIAIKVEAADYQPSVAKSIKAYSKKANIKGFRPGSVPTSLIQQMYGRSIRIDEVNKLLNEALVKYLQEKEIRVLGTPMPVLDKLEAIDWEHQQDFEFEYSIGMAGEFTCALSKQLKVTGYKITGVAKETVKDLVEKLRKTHGTAAVVAKSTAHDVVYGELHYPAQDFRVQTKIDVDKVGPKALALFVDLGPEDKITFDVAHVLQEDTKLPGVTAQVHEAMRRLGGQAEFTVEQVRRSTPAALTQAFFDKVLGQGIASTEQGFIEKLRTGLMQHKQQEADYRLEKAIQAALLKEATIVLPDDFLRRWLQERDKEVSKEQVAAYYQQYATELRWSILMEKLSKAHKLQVTHEEVVEVVQQRFQATSNTEEAAQNVAQLTQKFLKENNGQHYKQMYETLQAHKFLNFVKDQITIATQEVSAEEFDKFALE